MNQRALRTSGIEQLEPRAMLSSFGPPGGRRESHLGGESLHPRFGDFNRGPVDRASGEFGRHPQIGMFGSRPPATMRSDRPIAINIAFEPIMPPPTLTSPLSGDSSAHSSKAADSATPPQSYESSGELLANVVDVSAAGGASNRLASSIFAEDGLLRRQQPALASTSQGSSLSQWAEHKTLALTRRTVSEASAVGDENSLLELDADKPARKRKSVSAKMGVQLPADLAGAPILRPLRKQPAPATIDAHAFALIHIELPVDDGLIELLAIDIGQPPATERLSSAAMEPVAHIYAETEPVLELATAEDANPDNRAIAKSEDSEPPPAAPLE